MGMEMEISNRGVEFDNVSLGTVLRIMTSCGIMGAAAGAFGGLKLGALLFTKTDEEKKRAQKLTTYACYATGFVASAAVMFLYYAHQSHGGRGRGRYRD